MSDPTTRFSENYGFKFKNDEEKEKLINFFNKHHDLKNSFRYRMFNSLDIFKNATTEHTIITASRLRENRIRIVACEFALRDMSVGHYTTVEFGTPDLNDIDSFQAGKEFDDIPNIAIMSITNIIGNNIAKEYEACIYNPEYDLVNDSIRFV